MFNREYFRDSKGKIYMPLRLIQCSRAEIIEIVYIHQTPINIDNMSLTEHLRNARTKTTQKPLRQLDLFSK